MEKLIKTALGQWKIINPLKKAWVTDERESTPARQLSASKPNLAQGFYGVGYKGATPTQLEARGRNRPIVAGMMKDLADAHAAGSTNAVQHHADRLRNFIANAPVGDIDLAHLSDEHQKIKEALSGSHSGSKTYSHGFRDDDLLQSFDKHIGSSKNLHDLYLDQGLNAVRGLAHAHGINVDPYQEDFDSNLHGSSKTGNAFKNLGSKPDLIGDVQALVHGSYGNHKNLGSRDQQGFFYDVANSPYSNDPDQGVHTKAVQDAYNKMVQEGYEENPSAIVDAEKAVVNRGMSNFKHAHGIK